MKVYKFLLVNQFKETIRSYESEYIPNIGEVIAFRYQSIFVFFKIHEKINVLTDLNNIRFILTVEELDSTEIETLMNDDSQTIIRGTTELE